MAGAGRSKPYRRLVGRLRELRGPAGWTARGALEQWHPRGDDERQGHPRRAAETQVAFNLSEEARQTELVLTHSGWDSLPTRERAALMRHHAAGWSHHLQNLADYVAELEG